MRKHSDSKPPPYAYKYSPLSPTEPPSYVSSPIGPPGYTTSPPSPTSPKATKESYDGLPTPVVQNAFPKVGTLKKAQILSVHIAKGFIWFTVLFLSSVVGVLVFLLSLPIRIFSKKKGDALFIAYYEKIFNRINK